MKELVSFIVTTRNEERYIERCLRSIRNQTYKQIEVIVVDSASKDKTVDIARKYANRIIVKECIIPVGRNVGVSRANGRFLVFVDADIVLFRDWLEKAIAQLNGNTVALQGDLFPDDNGIRAKLLYWWFGVVNVFLRLIREPNIMKGGVVLIVTKEAYKRVNGFTNSFVGAEDWDFSLRLAKIGAIKYEPRLQGYFSVRAFRKYGYLKRLMHLGQIAYKYRVKKKPAIEYKR